MQANYEKGSILIFVLLILSLLSLMAITLLSVTTINYRAKILNSKSNQNFYIAESGLDEACETIKEIIREAISYGNKEADIFLNNFDLKSKKRIFFDNYFTLNQKESKTKPKDVFQLFEEYILSLKQTIFQTSYKNYIEMNIKTKIEQHEIIIEDQKLKPLKIISNSLKFSKVENDQGDKKEALFITIESRYTKNNIEKIINNSFIIKVPEYGLCSPGYINNTVKKISADYIWSNCIMIGGEIHIGKGSDKIHIDNYNQRIDIPQYINFEKIENKLICHNNDFILIDNSGIEFAIIDENINPIDIPENVKNIILNNPINGIIITAGNLYISGEINFTGVIITKDDINLFNTDNKKSIKIKYDKNTIAALLDKYDIYLEDIFKKYNDINNFVYIEKESKITEEIVPFDSLLDEHIESKDWKIIK